MKTKRPTRVFALVLALAMALSVSALANWTSYGRDGTHNAVVNSAPTSGSPSITQISLLNPNTGWDGVDNVPLMRTVGTGSNAVTYAYVLYDGHSDGCTLTKINCSATTPTVVWHKQLETTSGFQLSTPLLVPGDTEANDVIYAASNSGTVYKIIGLNAADSTGVATSVVYTVPSGQINTPIVKYGDYIYFGTWVGNGTIEGSTEPGRYYQVKVDNITGNHYEIQSVSSIYKGFYWAGAVMVNNYLYFGGDGGYLYWRPVGDGFGTTQDIDIYRTSLDLADEETENGASDVGNIRSSIMTDGENLYFTSQGKYLWCCTFDADNNTMNIDWKASLGGTSTSTPTKVGDRIYVGYYSGFNAGGVQCISNSTHAVTTVATGFPVQSSIVVKGTGTGTDYIYFNTNAEKGRGYCYRYTGSVGSEVWSTTGETYALGGMAIDNGIAVFGNDYNYLYVVK